MTLPKRPAMASPWDDAQMDAIDQCVSCGGLSYEMDLCPHCGRPMEVDEVTNRNSKGATTTTEGK